MQRPYNNQEYPGNVSGFDGYDLPDSYDYWNDSGFGPDSDSFATSPSPDWYDIPPADVYSEASTAGVFNPPSASVPTQSQAGGYNPSPTNAYNSWQAGMFEAPPVPVEPRKQYMNVSDAVRTVNSLLKKHTFCITGEVSQFNDRPNYTGIYFTIKDEAASLPCLIWRNVYKASGVELFEGAKVELEGTFDIYAPKGRMSFKVSRVKLAGEGQLRQQVAQLADRLRKEGLMNPACKRPLPYMPQTIGLVTSPNGAAVRDVLRTLRRRWPAARVAFAGVQVEGKQAPQRLIAALNCVVAAGAEVVLVVRGGGSFEDLMPFNDETLARTIASCPVPVVTGIGHEPDNSIADMVADVRASTPTAAAETVSPNAADLQKQWTATAANLYARFTSRLERSRIIVSNWESRPLFQDAQQLFASDAQTLDMCHMRLTQVAETLCAGFDQQLSSYQVRMQHAGSAMTMQPAVQLERNQAGLQHCGKTLTTSANSAVEQRVQAFTRLGETFSNSYANAAAVLTARLNDLSPLAILQRGWSVVQDSEGAVIKSVEQAQPGSALTVQLSDGALACRVEERAVSEWDELIHMEEQDE